VLHACHLHGAPGASIDGSARLVADALRRGRPVLADRGASGADLLNPGPENAYTSPGLVVERRTAPAWREALAAGLNDDWLETAGRAALEAGRSLAFEAFTDRLEAVLRRAAERRSALSPP
jgi:hypothetical protein